MKTQDTKQIALNYLNGKIETPVDDLSLQTTKVSHRLVYRSMPFNECGDFYEVEMSMVHDTICWKIVSRTENLSEVI
jgi:hypothetical protein